jgi:hypothetical protein
MVASGLGIIEFGRPNSSDYLLIDDTSEAALAMYVQDEKVTGYVWLYNHSTAPESFKESGHGLGPNIAGLIVDQPFERPQGEDEVSVAWAESPNGPFCAIYIRGQLHAMVGTDSKPGACILARLPGPMALPLNDPRRA